MRYIGLSNASAEETSDSAAAENRNTVKKDRQGAEYTFVCY